MQKIHSSLQEIKLVGIKVRTSNAQELEAKSPKIMPCVQHYFAKKLANEIPLRKYPGVTYCAYTEYESDYTGEYTFFIGEEVTSFTNIITEYSLLVIPKQKYIKFTTTPGPMPQIVINSWQKIWQMPEKDIGGVRNYHTDFELYDERALNPNNSIVDIYVGIK